MKNGSSFRTPLRLFVILLVIVLFAGAGLGSSSRAQAQGLPPPPEGPRIVGGAPADPGEWPWQVALVNGNATDLYQDQFCGGSLVAAQWVVTAAHCVYGSTPSSQDVVAGIYNLKNPEPGYQRRDVAQIIIHPNYNDNTSNSDIALLRLSSPVTLGGSGAAKTQAIQLVPPSIGNLAGVDSWVTGWGNTKSPPATQWPPQLYEVSVPIIANSICNDAGHYGGGITNNMLCAGLEEGGKDSCQGDSGGPLVVDNGGQWQLAGITSWGEGCAEPHLPGVYTRVSNFTTWVNSHIQTTTIKTFRSIGADDGWILESSETSGTGGTMNSLNTAFSLGDNTANKQFRAILSFNTSSLPDTAQIISVTLKIRLAGQAGTNPFNTHGDILADILSGAFSGLRTLELGDFAATSSRDGALVIRNTPVSNWYSASLRAVGLQYINLAGLTQFRLQFRVDDNDDSGADVLKFYSGDAAAADRPQLIVEYIIP